MARASIKIEVIVLAAFLWLTQHDQRRCDYRACTGGNVIVRSCSCSVTPPTGRTISESKRSPVVLASDWPSPRRGCMAMAGVITAAVAPVIAIAVTVAVVAAAAAAAGMITRTAAPGGALFGGRIGLIFGVVFDVGLLFGFDVFLPSWRGQGWAVCRPSRRKRSREALPSPCG